MISKRETERVVSSMICNGYERSLHRRCMHFARDVTFKIEYAPAEAAPPA
jgi:hypothetical protein